MEILVRIIPWRWLPWRVYCWLNDRPDTCWAHLVTRKLYGYEDDSTIFQDWICHDDTETCGRCYCGKLTKGDRP